MNHKINDTSSSCLRYQYVSHWLKFIFPAYWALLGLAIQNAILQNFHKSGNYFKLFNKLTFLVLLTIRFHFVNTPNNMSASSI